MSVDGLEESKLGIVIQRRSSIASLFAILRNPLKALPAEVFDKGLVVSRLFGRTRLYVTDPDLIQHLLVRQAELLSKGDEVQRVLGPALGNGLLTSDGAAWRWQRQSMAPAFQHERLRAFLPAMIAAAEQTLDSWREKGPGARVDLSRAMMATTFKIIVETMLSGPSGIDAATVERNVGDYLRPANWALVMALMRAPSWMPYPGRRRAERAAVTLRDAITRMIATRRQSGARDDLVALLLAARDPQTDRSMSDEEMTDNLVTFITAGHETTALGLTWAFLLLAAHPVIEARVLDEIDAVTAGASLKPAHVEKLIYTRQVLNEAMRLYPPAPMILRTARQPFDLPGLHVAAETMITIPIYAVHRHDRLWSQPALFDPDRFRPEAVKSRHRYAFMPFGAGQRVCIGNAFATFEAVTILAVILKAVRLTRLDDKKVEEALRVTLRPKRNVIMHVTPRGM